MKSILSTEVFTAFFEAREMYSKSFLLVFHDRVAMASYMSEALGEEVTVEDVNFLFRFDKQREKVIRESSKLGRIVENSHFSPDEMAAMMKDFGGKAEAK